MLAAEVPYEDILYYVHQAAVQGASLHFELILIGCLLATVVGCLLALIFIRKI